MINKKTVLVLGAGASMDYGFPSGVELLQDIINILKGKIFFRNVEILKAFISYIACCFEMEGKRANEEAYKKNRHNIDQFEERLIRSNAASIDDFLYRNEDLKTIGKILIILSISQYENERRLSYIERQATADHRYCLNHQLSGFDPYLSLTRGWYNNLWSKIYDGEIKENLRKITIISFNYDRSLEQYLFNSIKAMTNFSDVTVGDAICKNLLVHHVYGQLGWLSWQKNDDEGIINDYKPLPISRILFTIEDHHRKRPLPFNNAAQMFNYMNNTFGQDEIISSLCGLVGMIRTYTEASNEKTYESIMGKLAGAENLFFLGFGYHPINIKWLKQNSVEDNTNLTYAGTMFGKGNVSVWEIENQLKTMFSNSSNKKSAGGFAPAISKYKIKDYLENIRDIE